jgi:Bacterial transcriptional regulator
MALPLTPPPSSSHRSPVPRPLGGCKPTSACHHHCRSRVGLILQRSGCDHRMHRDFTPATRIHTCSSEVLDRNRCSHQLERYFERATFERYTPLTITQPARLRAVIDNVRAGSYAVVTGEVDEGVCGIAVPLRDQSGKTRTAIGVSMVRSRMSEVDIKERIVPRLQATAASVAAQLQQQPKRG